MDILNTCILNAEGAIDLSRPCFLGLNVEELVGITVVFFGIAVFLIRRARRTAKATNKILRPRAGWPFHTNLTASPHEFVMREKPYTATREMLDHGGPVAISARISGMGGIGKTTLAYAVARDMADERLFEGVWSIDAATPEGIRSAFRTLAARLELPEKDAPGDHAAKAALAHVCKASNPWLLIFDNATQETATNWLPRAGKVRTIITTRERDWGDDFAAISLDKMTEAEAVKLLQSHLPQRDKADLARIAKRLDYWPLALVAIAGYLRTQTDMTVERLFEKLGGQEERIGTLSGSEYFKPDDPATHNLAAALALSTDALSDDDKELLSLLAFLDPDDLWPEMIAEGCEREAGKVFDGTDLPGVLGRAKAEPDLIAEGFNRLAARSIIERHGESWRIHRLMAEFWRAGLDEETRADFLDAASRLVNAATPFEAGNPANWPDYIRILPHARALIEHGAKTQAAARLFNQVTGFALSRGPTESDLAFAEASVVIHEHLSPESGDLASSLNNLGMLYRNFMRYDDALSIQGRVREIRANLPEIGTKHPSYATTLDNIAGLYLDLKQYHLAEPLNLEALDIDRAALGEVYRNTIRDLANLGTLYYEWALTLDGLARKELQAKEDVFKPKALLAIRSVLGEYHGETATHLNNEALRLGERGRANEALEMMMRAASIFLDIFGAENDRALDSLWGFTILAMEAGKPELIGRLKALAKQVREEHRDWGMAKLRELHERYGEEETEKLAEAVAVEARRLEAAGAPQEKFTWVWEEFQSAVQALDLDPNPRPDFDERVAKAIEIYNAQAQG